MNNISIDSNEESAWKRKTSLIGIRLIIVILSIRFLTDIFQGKSNDISNYITIFAVIVFLSLFTYVKKTQYYEKVTSICIYLSFIFIYLRASLTGGLGSPAAIWLIVLPIASSFLLSKEKTYFVFVATLFTVLLTSQFPLVKFVNYPTEVISPLTTIAIYVSIVIVSTAFCLFHEEKRKESIENIEVQRMRILSTSRNIELGELASGIAHEINNPLTVIKLKAKKIKAEVSQDSEVGKEIDKIIEMTEKINTLAKSMKNLSMPEQDDGKIIKEKFGYIFKNVLNLLETKMSYSKIHFNVDCNIEHIDEYKVPIKIGHILLSVINNSYDSLLKKENKWITVKIDEQDGMLIFSVSDSGEGIKRKNYKKIFEPFYSEKDNRTGLGLSISRDNLSRVGGDISLKAGAINTTFIIKIPYYV